jgi:predicted membrane-bound spermidine synthase
MAEIDMGNGNQFDATNGGVTQDEHEITLAQSILQRENEVYQYQLNVFNFELMLSSMENLSWPTHLLPYRGMGREQLAANVLNDDDLDLAAELMFRDELRTRLRTEKIELKKTTMMLQSLVSQSTNILKTRTIISELKRGK